MKMRKFITFSLIILLIIFALLFAGYQWYTNAVFSESISEEEVSFKVSQGDNLISIIPELSQNGLISSADAAKIYIKLNNIEANIKAGNYSIRKGTNFPNLIEILEKGTFKLSVTVTIPEGMRYEEIGDLLNSKFASATDEPKYINSEFLKICENPDTFTFSPEVKAILDKYKPSGKPLRGLLFPDTYKFDFDSDALTVIETMLSNLDKRLIDNGVNLENLNKNQNNLNNIYDIITLASIIEKEAGNDPDRPIVSSVFHNRLKVNFPLQSDITIHFIKNDEDTLITFQDTKIDSPYNTYLHAGVTPTPINNPGISSILAALNPASTDYFYFIYDANGKLYYARTYQEHIANVNRYL